MNYIPYSELIKILQLLVFSIIRYCMYNSNKDVKFIDYLSTQMIWHYYDNNFFE